MVVSNEFRRYIPEAMTCVITSLIGRKDKLTPAAAAHTHSRASGLRFYHEKAEKWSTSYQLRMFDAVWLTRAGAVVQ